MGAPFKVYRTNDSASRGERRPALSSFGYWSGSIASGQVPIRRNCVPVHS